MSQYLSTQREFSRLAHAVNPSYQVLISGTVTDELTGRPPVGELHVRVESDVNGQFVAKAVEGGLFCIAGESRRLFPQLATQGASVVLSLTVANYQPCLYTCTIAANSSFPLPALSIQLQRVPIRIQGYVVEVTPTLNKPIAHARVRCTAASRSSGTTSALVTLRTPLQSNHPPGTIVQRCRFTPQGAVGQLVVGAAAGSTMLVLSEQMQVTVGNILFVGSEETGAYGIVAGYQRTSDQTVRVQLTTAFNRSFAAGTPVQCCSPTVSTTQTTLAQAAARGDGMLYLTDVPPLAANDAADDALTLVEANAAHSEYVALDALSDDNGYYRLDGIGGAVRLLLETQAPDTALHGEPIQWSIAYEQPVNTVDVRLLRS